MNKALIICIVSLLPQEHNNLYQNTLIGNTNGRFGNTFEYFYREYDIHDKMELKQRQNNESAIPAEGFEILCKRFGEVIIFAAFTENNISTGNTLNRLPNVILKTGVFQI